MQEDCLLQARLLPLALLVALMGPVDVRASDTNEVRAPVQFAQALDVEESDDPDGENEEEEEAGEEDLDELDAEGLGDADVDLDYSDLEEITVTGSAGKAIETDAAQSAIQFDSDDLQALGAADISDISKVTPNLEITTAGATSANFFIRGVGLADYSANSASAVAIYQDGVPLNSAALQLVGLFDVSSLVVLRGPQGAGSNRNASAGAIKIESRKPTGDLQANLRTSLGSYMSDDARKAFFQEYEGALEVPIFEDLLSSRLSFRLKDADPFMTNGCGGPTPNQPCRNRGLSGLPEAVGDEGNWAARGVFRYQPQTLDMDWMLRIQGGRLDQQSSLGQAMGTSPTLGRGTLKDYFEPDQLEEFRALRQGAGLDRVTAQAILANNLASGRPLDIRPYRGDYNRVGQTTRDTWGTALTGNIYFNEVGFLGPVTLETISSYDGYSRFRDTDQDFTPDVLFESIQEDSAWQFFQELKTTGEARDGLVRWEVGGYFLMEELESSSDQKTVSAAFDFKRNFEQGLKSFAFYGGVGWDFLDDFTLDAGVRYNWERKDFNFWENQSGIITVARPQESTWTAPTGLLSLTYRFTDDVSAHWKYSRGWKGGHYNANRLNVPPADPETIDALEAGFNGSWFDARLSVSGAFFYYKYQDYQVFLFENAVASPPILEIINASDAEQYGAEIEMDMRPLQDWTAIPEILSELHATVRFGWLESQFLDFVNLIERRDNQTNQIFQQVVNYTGNRLPNSPEFKVSAAIDWPFDLGRYGTLVPRYDIAWSDDIFFDPNEGRGTINVLGEEKPPFTVGQPGYTVHNLRLGWRDPNGRFEVSGWVRNLTDTRYKTFAFDASIFAAVVINFVGEPRTVGADVSILF